MGAVWEPSFIRLCKRAKKGNAGGPATMSETMKSENYGSGPETLPLLGPLAPWAPEWALECPVEIPSVSTALLISHSSP